MIYLHKFGPGFGLRETGPFVLKTISYMRLTGVDFTEVIQGDPRKAPKKKIPYILDDGEAIGDSTFIIKHLKSKFGDPLAEGLSPDKLAAGHAIKVMLEERTYWAGMIYPRWVKTDHHKLIADTFFAEIPSFIRMTIFRSIAKGVAKAAAGHGIGHHTDAEIFALGLDDIKTVETLLGKKKFMLGAKPAEVDCTAYAFLHGMSAEVFPTPIQEYIKGSKTLTDYVARMDDAVFGA
ncbi:MAG: glutathione S-transferase family protein [Maricaulaceae bacterium]